MIADDERDTKHLLTIPKDAVALSSIRSVNKPWADEHSGGLGQAALTREKSLSQL